MFAQPKDGKKRMDEDSDDDDAPVAAKKQTVPEAPPMDLLDMGSSNPPATNGFSDLLGGIGSAAPVSNGNSLLDMGSGNNDLMNVGSNPA